LKLSALTIYIIGLAVAIIALSFGFFHQFMPNMKDAESFNARAEELQAEAAKEGQAKKRLENAKSLVEQEAAKWRAVVARRTPESSVKRGGIDLSVNGWQLTVDSQQFRNNIQRDVNAQIRVGGVKILQAPTIPGPGVNESANSLINSYYQLQTYGFPVLIFNLGTITVEGTYDQIMDNVRSYASMPNYLAVADGLALTGTNGQFTGTYNLTVIGFIRATDIFPSVPEIGAAGGAGGGSPFGGGPGGPPPGFGGPGGPPPGFGGAPPSAAGGRGPAAASGGGK